MLEPLQGLVDVGDQRARVRLRADPVHVRQLVAALDEHVAGREIGRGRHGRTPFVAFLSSMI